MSNSTEFLTNRLRDEGEKSIQFFSNITAEDWDITIYSDGSRWNVRQVLAHFALAESSLCYLVEQIAAGGPGTPEDFDLDRYNEAKVSTVGDVSEDELIKLFRNNRQETINIVSKLTEAELTKKGRHPFLGDASLIDIIKLIYRHNQIHIREIRIKLNG